jgi:hypothetical protein
VLRISDGTVKMATDSGDLEPLAILADQFFFVILHIICFKMVHFSSAMKGMVF